MVPETLVSDCPVPETVGGDILTDSWSLTNIHMRSWTLSMRDFFMRLIYQVAWLGFLIILSMIFEMDEDVSCQWSAVIGADNEEVAFPIS